MRWSMCIQDILQFSIIVHFIFFVEKCDHNVQVELEWSLSHINVLVPIYCEL
jgi:hypothetical protein